MLVEMLRKTDTSALSAYLGALPRGGVGAFARRLGISPIYLSQLAAMANGRVPSPALCVEIERATDRQVTRRELRPADWTRIWPELMESDGEVVR